MIDWANPPNLSIQTSQFTAINFLSEKRLCQSELGRAIPVYLFCK